ncbi:xanthine dehydrogenase accessory protein XdhC [Roseibium aggregatum]|uniref:Xanthine dehydrogenase accessory protein XdhC n=1 Tax=Roseibium aggregatum TaxID=187304 RepID=A0A939J004_9HYPH|nr:xanthine dehydrogenase accessory protein XdhC [Roseibium aggregatum]MBN9670601.1 xanthine dehydrogenase accessory protein XdhC [Roseibium aggregatum]
MKVWAQIAACLKDGEGCALVTVAQAKGSTPREAGARMVVRADGGFYGTIGGGTLELAAIRRAAQAASQGRSGFFCQKVSLGPDLGQCCGGRVDLAIEVLTENDRAPAETLALRESEGKPFGTVCTLENGKLGARSVLDTPPAEIFGLDGDEGANRRTLSERFGERVRPLYLFGAGHVGRALVLALASLPFEVVWVDSRAEQFPAATPANTRKILSSTPAAVLDRAPDGAFILAMTHSHALDEDIMACALLHQRFGYCGVIGSETKRARFQKRLKARGLNDALISGMVCPVGVTGIRSKLPAAIAAGIAVDLLQRDETRENQAAVDGSLAQIIPVGQ